MDEPVERAGFPFRFRCRRSGNCCAIPGGFVRVDAAERTAIAAALGMDERAFASRYLQQDGQRLKDGFGNRCVFLQDGAPAGCSIYDVRPARCRTWPFWPEIRTDAALRDLVMRTCPGIEATGAEG
ncbi:MAG: YkgJ family cysteine cluster protein [Planctomycetes bacterium]|nr:YkgJ family cysteine cluster protein [Planctomycetota bacterium]